MSEPIAGGGAQHGAAMSPFRIERWRVDPEANLLSREGKGIRVEPRVMQVLVCLASRPGRPVSREELMSVAWSDVVVGDDALNAAISKLRRLFGDDSRKPRFIETVPKVGYRLIAPVFRGDALPPEVVPSAEPQRRRLVPIIVTVAAVVAVAAALLWLRTWGGSEGSTTVRMIPITSDAGIEVEPALSPGTAERVAYAWKGPTGDDWSIWVRTVAAGQPLQLTAGAGSDHHPAWSPDARWIAFVRTGGGECTVMRVPALGGNAETIAPCTAPVYDLDWSPDGRRLAWPEGGPSDAPHRIVAVDQSTGTLAALTNPDPRSLGDLAVAFSPEGETFAFIRSPALGVEEIWLSETGGSPRQLTRLEGKIHGFDWASSEELIVSSNRGGLFALWSVPVDGGEARWITGGPSDIDAPSSSADGRTIVFEQWSDEANLHRIDLESGASTPIIRSTRWDWDPVYSPDGSRIAFVSDRSGSPELWLARSDGSQPEARSSFGGPYLSKPRWSPDGTTIAFDAREGGGADVWVIRAEGGAPRRITDDPAQDLAPFWAADGRRIFFGSNRGDGWSIWSASPDGTDLREEIPGAWTGAWMGERLVFTRRGESGLWTREGEAPPVRLTEKLAPMDASSWTTSGEAVYYVRRQTADDPVLVRLDPATGFEHDLLPLNAALRNSSIAVAPDGGSVLVSRVDRLEADIVLLYR